MTTTRPQNVAPWEGKLGQPFVQEAKCHKELGIVSIMRTRALLSTAPISFLATTYPCYYSPYLPGPHSFLCQEWIVQLQDPKARTWLHWDSIAEHWEHCLEHYFDFGGAFVVNIISQAFVWTETKAESQGVGAHEVFLRPRCALQGFLLFQQPSTI